VRGILSVDISEWERPGVCTTRKPAKECTRDEIRREVWEQLKRSLNVGSQVLLRDDHLHGWFLDTDILHDPGNPDPDRETNLEPLLVNLVDTWKLRPDAVTRIPNLFLASDYVRTYTDLATMEGANEAARRAVNGIIDASGSSAPYCRIWNLHEPEVLIPWRALDLARYRAGLPWDDTLVTAGLAAVDGALAAGSTFEQGVAAGIAAAQRVGVLAAPAAPAPDGDAASTPATLLGRIQRDAQTLLGMSAAPPLGGAIVGVEPPLGPGVDALVGQIADAAAQAFAMHTGERRQKPPADAAPSAPTAAPTEAPPRVRVVRG